MAPIPGDFVFYGFGAAQTSWVTSNASFRNNRVIRASNDRVDILGFDVSWQIGSFGVTASFVIFTQIAIWRTQQLDPPRDPIPFSYINPFAASNTVAPAGVELLWTGRSSGLHQLGEGTILSNLPIDTTEMSWRFPPGVIYAKQGQELWVQATQPVSNQKDIYATGAIPAFLTLSVEGVDYGALDPSAQEKSQYRSLPRYG